MTNICPICASNTNDEISCPNCQWDLAEYKEDAKGFKAEKERRIKWGCNIWQKNQELLKKIESLKTIINSNENEPSETLKKKNLSTDTKKPSITQSEDILAFCFTIDSFDSWKYSKPCKISFLDKNIEVNSWNNLLVECCKILYDHDKNIILSFRNNPKMKGRKRFNFLDYNYLEGKGEFKKVAENLYVETNSSSNVITNLIRTMLNEYKIDISELKICLSKLPDIKAS